MAKQAQENVAKEPDTTDKIVDRDLLQRQRKISQIREKYKLTGTTTGTNEECDP